MTIVLDEHEWSRNMIESRSLGKKPSETLFRIAKYYFSEGCSKKETRNKLDTFLLSCDPTASLPKWSDILDYVTSRASKSKEIKIEDIVITQPEIERIDALEGKQIRRLAFTLLCLAKYWNCVNPQGDNWVNNKDSEIMRMANVNTSIKRQSLMYHTLNEEGLIQFSKKVDNTNVKVLFAQDGDIAMRISDFRNLGYQYLMYHGEPYFQCENCGLTVKMNIKTGRSLKYCNDCALEIKMRQNIESVMRQRAKNRVVGKNNISKPVVAQAI